MKLVLFAALIFYAQNSCSQVMRYVDEAGQEHFVSDPSKVPQKYRRADAETLSLKEITRYRHREGRQVENAAERNVAKGNTIERNSTERTPRSYATNRRVEIYVTDWCGVCKALERHLQQRRIRYITYDIEKDRAAEKRYRLLGGRGVPLVKIGSQVVRGFDPSAIEAALR